MKVLFLSTNIPYEMLRSNSIHHAKNITKVITGTPLLVATIRALKYNGGVKKEDLATENIDALKKGIVNLGKHIENSKIRTR